MNTPNPTENTDQENTKLSSEDKLEKPSFSKIPIWEQTRKQFSIVIRSFVLSELKKKCWEKQITITEFFVFVSKLIVTGDIRVFELMDEAKAEKSFKTEQKIASCMDDDILYDVIQKARAQKNKKLLRHER